MYEQYPASSVLSFVVLEPRRPLAWILTASKESCISEPLLLLLLLLLLPSQVTGLTSSAWTGTPPKAWWCRAARTASSPSSSGTPRRGRAWPRCEFCSSLHSVVLFNVVGRVHVGLSPPERKAVGGGQHRKTKAASISEREQLAGNIP